MWNCSCCSIAGYSQKGKGVEGMLINMEALLRVAKEQKFAVPAFNISSLEIFKAVLETAEECHAPVIVEVHPDELSYVGSAFIETMKAVALRSSIPVVIHLDHGGSVEDIIKAIHCGFTSVMIDGSLLSYDENITQTKEVVKLAHPLHISVEAELGTIGQTGNSMEGGTQGIIYTDPKQALDFVNQTGVDSLAVAIGTAHGLYPKDFTPKLNLKLLETIHEFIDLPLVLHGGSGNPDHEVEASIAYGICKVNISSDVKHAFFSQVRKFMEEHPDAYEPNVIYPSCMNAAKKVIRHKMELLHTKNRANLYIR